MTANSIGLELRDGEAVGRDPALLSEQEFRALGHEPLSAIEAIRAHCLDCCVHSPSEVRNCTAVRCPSWPFRMGRSPWKAKRQISEATKAKLAASLERARAAKRGEA